MRKNTLIAILAAAVALCVGLIIFLRISAVSYKVPDFSGKTKSDVEAWIKADKIPPEKVIYAYAYSAEFEKDDVISQSIAGGSSMKSTTSLTIRLSQGADPSTKVQIPEFTDLTADQVLQWFSDSGFENVTIQTEVHDELEEGTFIRVSPASGSKVQDTAEITIYVSAKNKTPDPVTNTVVLPNFSGKTRSEVKTWCDQNGVYVRFSTQTNNNIAEGYFISCTTPAGTEIQKGSTIRVNISAGRRASTPTPLPTSSTVPVPTSVPTPDTQENTPAPTQAPTQEPVPTPTPEETAPPVIDPTPTPDVAPPVIDPTPTPEVAPPVVDPTPTPDDTAPVNP